MIFIFNSPRYIYLYVRSIYLSIYPYPTPVTVRLNRKRKQLQRWVILYVYKYIRVSMCALYGVQVMVYIYTGSPCLRSTVYRLSCTHIQGLHVYALRCTGYGVQVDRNSMCTLYFVQSIWCMVYTVQGYGVWCTVWCPCVQFAV